MLSHLRIRAIGLVLAAQCVIPALAQHQSPGLVGPDGSLPVFHAALREQLNFTLGWSALHATQPQGNQRS